LDLAEFFALFNQLITIHSEKGNNNYINPKQC